MFALGEGPVLNVLQFWQNETPFSLPSAGFTLYDGGYAQEPWPWLESDSPGYAQNFRGLAYLAASDYGLGRSASPPNLTFETRFAISGAVYEIARIATSPPTFQAQYFDVVGNGADEDVTVPPSSPYEVQTANQEGFPFAQTYLEDFLPGQNAGGVSSGVFYTDTQPPEFLTKVTGTPATGQYNVGTAAGQSVIYTFAAGDAGAAVTIVDLAVSPGVNYVSLGTGTISNGSTTLSSLALQSTASGGVSAGSLVLGAGIPAGTVATSINIGTGTATLSLPGVRDRLDQRGGGRCGLAADVGQHAQRRPFLGDARRPLYLQRGRLHRRL